ncbi:hypothetical protein [Psychrobacter sp. 16-MNA-CIBAN-0192]|uniref:hypothetical protein n=1 Tax=Psychrobacter sp. 16-MNA-CIBAN-0192 TaxID=3140448 RepID=UPI003326B286
MSVVNNRWVKWQHVAGIGMLCGLTVTGCSRSDKADDTEVKVEPATESAAAPAVSCDNPLVQDRLRASLQNMLYQEAQILSNNYANNAEISLESGAISSKVNGVAINVQNASVLQEANANGMTTCQASVSITVPTEDLYQAGQVSAANNQPGLETVLAQGNIRINDNMLIDDAFTYVAGAQGGQVRVRIAGQPALTSIVADVLATSLLKSAIDSLQVEVPVQVQPQRRAPVQNSNQNQPVRQPKPAAPAKPAQPVKPAKPVQPAKPVKPSTNNANNQSNESASVPKTPSKPETSAPVTPKAPASVPKDESINMVIIEDDTATY